MSQYICSFLFILQTIKYFKSDKVKIFSFDCQLQENKYEYETYSLSYLINDQLNLNWEKYRDVMLKYICINVCE